MRSVAIWLIVSSAIACSGCGGNGSDNGGSDSSGSGASGVAAAPTAAAAEGCDADHPQRVQATGDLAGLVVVCGGTNSLTVQNASSGFVLAVSPAAPGYQESASAGDPESFSDRAVQAAVPSGCDADGCVLTPGATVTVSGGSAPRLNVGVQAADTAIATAAAQAGSWVSQHVTTPGVELLNSTVDCAGDVQGYLRSYDPNDAARQAIGAGFHCRELYQKVNTILDGGEDADKASVGVLHMATEFAPNLERDLSDIGITRVFEHLHR